MSFCKEICVTLILRGGYMRNMHYDHIFLVGAVQLNKYSYTLEANDKTKHYSIVAIVSPRSS